MENELLDYAGFDASDSYAHTIGICLSSHIVYPIYEKGNISTESCS